MAAASAAAAAASEDGDAPFEAFATCDFATAARLALAELQAAEPDDDAAAAAAAAAAGSGDHVPLPLALPLPLPLPAGAGSKCRVALTESSTRCDKLAAVALQCGLELRREEEAKAVGAYYARVAGGRVPFPVAMIWLQILLSQGGRARSEEAKRVLLAVRGAIEAAWGRKADGPKGAQQQGNGQEGEEEGEGKREDEDEEAAAAAADEDDGSTEGSGATAESPITAAAATATEGGRRGPDEAELRSMYAQATELLVLRVLLPQGEGPAAMELLQQQKPLEGPAALLEAAQRQRLLEACRSDARRRAALGSGSGVAASKGGAKRRASPSAKAGANNGRHHQQHHHHHRGAPPPPHPPQALPPAHYAISSGRLTPSALAAARARSPSPGWGSLFFLGPLFGFSSSSAQQYQQLDQEQHRRQQQQQRQGRGRRLLLAVVGFCVLALGFHARRGRGVLRAAFAAVLGTGARRQALGNG